jgi:hypothetical protein
LWIVSAIKPFPPERATNERQKMRFAFIPKGQYKIGQIIQVQGRKMRVESYTHTGKNVTVHSLENAPKFERIVCVCTDSPAIEGVTA